MKMVSLTATNTGRKELFIPQRSREVALYVCGITPYDYAHLGHGRCYVMFDVLYRLLNLLGYRVTYVRNFTDIDDKLLHRAQKELGDPLRYHEIADKFIAAYHQDMERLNCILPAHEPRVTEHLPEIIAFVDGLVKKGLAYVSGSDVYFSIDAYPAYGALSKRDLDDLRVGARVAVNEKKRNPLDFALWKGEKEGTFWPSPWGYGRPGWHIECSALAKRYLGDTLDIHGGGMDLIFPHHENEQAQSQGLSDCPFVKTWMHVAFVQVNKEKMSKSLGNFFTLRDIFAQYDPMIVRYMLLTHHYRNPLDFSFDELENAAKGYQKLCKVVSDAPVVACTEEAINTSALATKILDFLCDDLNTQGAFGVIFEQARFIAEHSQERGLIKALMQQILGLTLEPIIQKALVITPEIQALIDEREKARAEKNWQRADQLRDELKLRGFDVQDKKLHTQ